MIRNEKKGNTSSFSRKGVAFAVAQQIDLKEKKELKKFDVLNRRVFNELADNLNAFRTGNIDENATTNFDDIARILVSNIFNIPSSSVKNYDYNKLIFNDYRELGHKILDGLEESTRLIKKYNNSKKLNAYYRDILKDVESIKKYVLDNFTGSTLFGDSIKTELTVKPNLKKEYAIYIDRYGFPENAIFKSELISEIIKEID